jgi:hypothetical protein
VFEVLWGVRQVSLMYFGVSGLCCVFNVLWGMREVFLAVLWCVWEVFFVR